MTIDQAVVRWDGFPGAPGYSVFYALPEGNVAAKLVDFFTELKTAIPSNVTVTVPASGNSYNQASGALTGVWSGGTGGTVDCTGTAVYAAPVGASVTWITDTFVSGKRIKGRTYLVPMHSAIFDMDGSLLSTFMAGLYTACTNLISGADGHLVVWHRPTSAGDDGIAATVTDALINDKASVLRSRRP
jgi:hypothetical protein